MKVKKTPEDFQVGQKVTWRSQARGAITTKTGVVVAIKPTGISSKNYALKHYPEHRRMFDGELDSKKTMLLIEVRVGTTRPKLYLPYPSTLKVVD